MGVKGLHARLKAHCNEVDALVDYTGLRVGVDALCWVYRAVKHANASGIHDVDTLCAGVSKFFRDYLAALTREDVRVLAVFDGQAPAAKRANRPRGNESWYAPCVTAAYTAASDAGAVCEIAAGEADAHLVALARSGTVCCVLTDDSDLVALGCPRTLFKAKLLRPKGRYTLFGDEFELSSLGASPSPFLGWSHERFVAFCVACGCDYVENVPGVGPARALALSAGAADAEVVLQRLLREPRCPEGFADAFRAAVRLFTAGD